MIFLELEKDITVGSIKKCKKGCGIDEYFGSIKSRLVERKQGDQLFSLKDNGM
jgi:hypothetical protein